MFDCVSFLADTVSGCAATADIGFLVDGSKDIGSTNFVLEKIFIKAIVNRFPVSRHQSHIGITTYAATAKSIFKFGVYNRASSILRMIENIPFPKRYGRNLAGSVRAAYWHFFAKAPTYIHRALVVLVGGRQTSKNYRLLRRMRNRLLRNKVYVYVILIGKVNNRYASSLALNKKHVFRVPSFRKLISKARFIGRAICDEMVSYRFLT